MEKPPRSADNCSEGWEIPWLGETSSNVRVTVTPDKFLWLVGRVKQDRLEKSNMSKFLIYKASNGFQYYWNLKAPNGEVIATSEMYNSKQAAQNGIQSVKIYAGLASIEDTTALQRRF